ncbi:MAG: peptidoglycan-binding domain-containing protein, partial [Patescibacteria group bacterium]
LNLLILQLQALLVQAKAQGISLPAGTEAVIGTLPTPTTPTTPTTPATPSTGASAFTRSLEVGMTGEDVKQLQIYLNANGFRVAASGPGSPGNETTRFGAGTRGALARFQAANGISPAVGYFGPKTRAYMNANP